MRASERWEAAEERGVIRAGGDATSRSGPMLRGWPDLLHFACLLRFACSLADWVVVVSVAASLHMLTHFRTQASSSPLRNISSVRARKTSLSLVRGLLWNYPYLHCLTLAMAATMAAMAAPPSLLRAQCRGVDPLGRAQFPMLSLPGLRCRLPRLSALAPKRRLGGTIRASASDDGAESNPKVLLVSIICMWGR